MPADSGATPRGRAAGIATTLMAALAGGAVWCLFAIHAHQSLAAFGFVIALVSVGILRANGQAGRGAAALVAFLCVALAALYSFSLQAVAQMSSLFDLPMGQTLRQMGVGMAVDIALAHLRGWNLLLVLAAAVAAAGGILLPRRR
ncbi:hypothetical protein [Dokdonella sp.]|uniref:hypothetical protein n=1 Tax=Dokdonella sp. TaxID=2291710 RepID=UPI0031BF50A8|nr:hypothetical protein [Dokdonella sp.]